jgi:hypothetical protein
MMDQTAAWSHLTDAYGQPYDPRTALDAIVTGDAAQAYDELWQRVHHQGDLGTAAYAVVPELARLMANAPLPDWRAYALIATIEERRAEESNPSIPDWLSQHYAAAIREIVRSATQHLRTSDADLEVRSLLATIAQAKGQRTIGAMCLWTEDERAEAMLGG